MVGATYDNIMMVEGEMKEVSEAVMLEATSLPTRNQKHCKVQMELMEETGKTENVPIPTRKMTTICVKPLNILL